MKHNNLRKQTRNLISDHLMFWRWTFLLCIVWRKIISRGLQPLSFTLWLTQPDLTINESNYADTIRNCVNMCRKRGRERETDNLVNGVIGAKGKGNDGGSWAIVTRASNELGVFSSLFASWRSELPSSLVGESDIVRRGRRIINRSAVEEHTLLKLLHFSLPNKDYFFVGKISLIFCIFT